MSKSDEQRVANGLDPDVRVVVVGATGAVGREALALLESRGHPREHVVAVASERSAGSCLPYEGGDLRVRSIAQLDELVQADVLVLLAVSADLARELAPRLAAVGARVVDNSSAFRSDPDVPLVVPEVNASALNSDARLVANPNCSTILMLVALEPLRRSFGVERVVISTYQAVSGAGQAAMDELRDQTRDVLEGKPAEPRVFPEPCAFNAFPHESTLDPATGMNEEERKLIRESRRVWADAEARIVPTCVRVPVLRTHCQSLLVTLAERGSLSATARALGVDHTTVGRRAGRGK